MNKTYVTIQGDTWDLVAYKNYGTSLVMHKIIEANLEHIDTVVFRAGTELTLPELDLTNKKAGSPPWVR